MTEETHTDWSEQGKKYYLNKVSEIAQDYIEYPEFPAGVEIEDIEFILNDSNLEIDLENHSIKANLSYCFNFCVPDYMLDRLVDENMAGADVEITASLEAPFQIE